MEINGDIAQMLDAVRDPVRLELIFLIGGQGGLNVTEIASRFKLSRPAVSHHLKVLRMAGIIKGEKQGLEVFYRLDRQRIVECLRSLAGAIETCCPMPDDPQDNKPGN
ncbi:MAG: winged helix-turn-helix transcriptional regulator [Firmicutes bacterium]|nr:winged helix-turn-helix transcriptional regulator [Bacillota bacterium]